MYDVLGESTYRDIKRVQSFSDLLLTLKEDSPSFDVAYHNLDDPVPLEEEFDRVSKAVYASHDLVYVVEEIDLYTSSHYMPFSLERIIAVGRHRNLSLFVTTRRPHSLHPLIRSQLNSVVSFKQTEPRDLEWIEDVLGEGMAEKVRTLKKYECVEWSDYENPQEDVEFSGGSSSGIMEDVKLRGEGEKEKE